MFLLIAALAAVACDIWVLQIDLSGDAKPFATLTFVFTLATAPALAASFSRRFNDIGLPGRSAAMVVVVSYVFPTFLPYEPSGLTAMEWLFLAVDLVMLAIALLPSQRSNIPDGPNPIEVTP